MNGSDTELLLYGLAVPFLLAVYMGVLVFVVAMRAHLLDAHARRRARRARLAEHEQRENERRARQHSAPLASGIHRSAA